MAALTYATADAAATRDLGARLGRVLQPGTLVLLIGPLGAGKTTLAQGIAAGMGVTQRVISPSFVLVREYVDRAGGRLIHMDFYRLSGPAEALDLGLEDYLAGDDVVLVEWPDRAAAVLPAEALHVAITFDQGDRRRIDLVAVGESAEATLAVLAGAEGEQVA